MGRRASNRPSCQAIRRYCQKARQRFRRFLDKNWKGTGALLPWVSVSLCSFCLGLAEGAFMRPAWVGALAVFLLSFSGAMLGLWLLGKLWKLLFGKEPKELLSCLLLCALCVLVMTWDTYTAGFAETAAFAAGFGLALALLLKSLYALLFCKVRTKAIYVSIFLTAVPVAAVAALMMSGGFQDSYVEEYLKIAGEKGKARERLSGQERADFREALEMGSYTVRSVTYGMDGADDLVSATTDISMFARNNGVNGFLKERYQGFSLKEVPLEGIAWFPQEASGCPALFLIHGNHGWTTDSYLGYGYLGAYLASHGYVVVSVDENACNGLYRENDGRAVLLLENIKQVEAYNQQEGNPLYQKIDYGNLALAGHSRGGEAIAEACLFNDLAYYPDNGKRAFDYHFAIQSLIAIAPTCGQYQPSGRSVELSDVNYLLLHGANDQDVTTFMGMEQYEDVSFSGKKDCLKTSLYAAGLNHGQFNSLWGKYDAVKPMGFMLNVGNLLPQEEQQEIAKILIKAFLGRTMGQPKGGSSQEGEAGGSLAGLLTDCGKYQELLPKTLYVQSYETSGTYMLCDFEEDARLETGTAEGVLVQTKQMAGWWEEQLVFSNGDSRGNHAAILKKEPGQEAVFCLSFPEQDLEGKALQFDIMDMQEGFQEGKAGWLEAEVAVTDAYGATASVPVDAYACLYPPFPVRLNKLQYLWGAADNKHQFQTVSVPMSGFGGVDRSRICNIEFRFAGGSMKAAMDNIGIR